MSGLVPVAVASAAVAGVGLGWALRHRAERREWRTIAEKWRMAALVWEANAQEAQRELLSATLVAAQLTEIVQSQDQILVQFACPSMN